MSDQPENLVLVYLRRIDGRMERMEQDISDIKHRLGHLEESVGTLATGYAGLQIWMDRLEGRLERIERRIDLSDARA